MRRANVEVTVDGIARLGLNNIDQHVMCGLV